jgi:hypothetical protein
MKIRYRQFVTYALVSVSVAVTLEHRSLCPTDTVPTVAIIGKTSLRLYPFHTSFVSDRLLNTDPNAVVPHPHSTPHTKCSNKQTEERSPLFLKSQPHQFTLPRFKIVSDICVFYTLAIQCLVCLLCCYRIRLCNSRYWAARVQFLGIALVLSFVLHHFVTAWSPPCFFIIWMHYIATGMYCNHGRTDLVAWCYRSVHSSSLPDNNNKSSRHQIACFVVRTKSYKWDLRFSRRWVRRWLSSGL